MSTVAPKVRQYLSADALFDVVRSGVADSPAADPRETDISLPEALMSAFAMLSLTSPSRLAVDQERTEGNLERLDGIERVPCDTPMRERLDPISPASLQPWFKRVCRQLQRGKALEPMTFRDGHS